MKNDILHEMPGEEYGEALLLNAQICSLRQAAEWGNRNLPSIFARLQLQETVAFRKTRRLIE
jgi:hypothetical protein